MLIEEKRSPGMSPAACQHLEVRKKKRSKQMRMLLKERLVKKQKN